MTASFALVVFFNLFVAGRVFAVIILLAALFPNNCERVSIYNAHDSIRIPPIFLSDTSTLTNFLYISRPHFTGAIINRNYGDKLQSLIEIIASSPFIGESKSTVLVAAALYYVKQKV